MLARLAHESFAAFAQLLLYRSLYRCRPAHMSFKFPASPLQISFQLLLTPTSYHRDSIPRILESYPLLKFAKGSFRQQLSTASIHLLALVKSLHFLLVGPASSIDSSFRSILDTSSTSVKGSRGTVRRQVWMLRSNTSTQVRSSEYVATVPLWFDIKLTAVQATEWRIVSCYSCSPCSRLPPTASLLILSVHQAP